MIFGARGQNLPLTGCCYPILADFRLESAYRDCQMGSGSNHLLKYAQSLPGNWAAEQENTEFLPKKKGCACFLASVRRDFGYGELKIPGLCPSKLKVSELCPSRYALCVSCTQKIAF